MQTAATRVLVCQLLILQPLLLLLPLQLQLTLQEQLLLQLLLEVQDQMFQPQLHLPLLQVLNVSNPRTTWF